jgi:hypothetical protein
MLVKPCPAGSAYPPLLIPGGDLVALAGVNKVRVCVK